MITEIEIENYKSLHRLNLKVGRFNVLIGENGCGKSNILEAITFAAAAEANKLDNEFLVSRGIRVTEPELMRAGFNSENQSKDIKINLTFSEHVERKEYRLFNDNQQYSAWENKIITTTEDVILALKKGYSFSIFFTHLSSPLLI